MLRKRTFACVFAVSVVNACESDEDWLEFEGYRYYVSNADGTPLREDTTWRRARDRCLACGGDLATILSVDESHWLTNIV